MPANTGKDLERYVAQLLRLSGYDTRENVIVDGTQIDVVALRDEPLLRVRYLVECTDQAKPVPIDYVKEKGATLVDVIDDEYVTCVMVVSRSGFSPQARQFAESKPRLILKSLEDLEAGLIDFRPYRDWYVHNYEASAGTFREARLHEHYVETSARDEAGHVAPVGESVRGWLADARNNVLFLLGDYGAGKTSFLRHFTYQQLKGEPEPSGLLPLLIPLRDYRSAINLRQVVTDTLINEYGVQLRSFQAFERYCSLGRVVLLLDGFDEMAAKSDELTLVDCLSQIFILAETNSKLVVSCRSNFFRSHAQLLEKLQALSIDVPGNTASEVERRPLGRHGRLITVCPLSPSQIQEFVAKRFPEEGEALLAQMAEIHDLSDLSRRPVLLDMILRTLPELGKSDKALNSATLYQHYTDRWTLRDRWRLNMPLEARQELCEALAWSFMAKGRADIAYQDLRQVLRSVLHEASLTSEHIELALNDIQTCSFLVRTGEGENYAFAHKSFAEFFVARQIARGLLGEVELAGGDPLAVAVPADSQPQWPHSGPRWSNVDELKSQNLELLLKGLHSVPIRLAELFTPVVLNERLAGVGAYATPSDDWEHQSGKELLGASLEKRVHSIFADAGGVEPQASVPFDITPEIATFAVEILEARDVGIGTLARRCGERGQVRVLAGVMRFASSPRYFETHREELAKFLQDADDPALQAAAAAALAQTTFVEQAANIGALQTTMDPLAFQYLVYLLAEAHPERTAGALNELEQSGLLDSFGELATVHALRTTTSDSEMALTLARKLDALIDVGMDPALILDAAGAALSAGGEGTILEVIELLNDSDAPISVKLRAIALLEAASVHRGMVRRIQHLKLRAESEPIRAALQRVEENARVTRRFDDVRRQRDTTGSVGTRDKMWASLRR